MLWEGMLVGRDGWRGGGRGEDLALEIEWMRHLRGAGRRGGGRGEEWKGWAGGRRLGWEGRGRTRCGSFAEEFYEGLAVVGSAEERCCSHCGCGVDIKAEVRWALEVVQCSIAV
jgi:hypothetical protein